MHRLPTSVVVSCCLNNAEHFTWAELNLYPCDQPQSNGRVLISGHLCEKEDSAIPREQGRPRRSEGQTNEARHGIVQTRSPSTDLSLCQALAAAHLAPPPPPPPPSPVNKSEPSPCSHAPPSADIITSFSSLSPTHPRHHRQHPSPLRQHQRPPPQDGSCWGTGSSRSLPCAPLPSTSLRWLLQLLLAHLCLCLRLCLLTCACAYACACACACACGCSGSHRCPCGRMYACMHGGRLIVNTHADMHGCGNTQTPGHLLVL
jgi:hypothetical protein